MRLLELITKFRSIRIPGGFPEAVFEIAVVRSEDNLPHTTTRLRFRIIPRRRARGASSRGVQSLLDDRVTATSPLVPALKIEVRLVPLLTVCCRPCRGSGVDVWSV